MGKRVKYTGSHHPELMDEFGTAIRRGTRPLHITVQWDNGCECEVFEQDLKILEPVRDPVNQPQHYQFFPDLEAIEVIARSTTQEQFYGYALGNALKYRLRAGSKDDLEQDIAKAKKYIELYEEYKHLCHA